MRNSRARERQHVLPPDVGSDWHSQSEQPACAAAGVGGAAAAARPGVEGGCWLVARRVCAWTDTGLWR
jgi:hypothetical protein